MLRALASGRMRRAAWADRPSAWAAAPVSESALEPPGGNYFSYLATGFWLGLLTAGAGVVECDCRRPAYGLATGTITGKKTQRGSAWWGQVCQRLGHDEIVTELSKRAG